MRPPVEDVEEPAPLGGGQHEDVISTVRWEALGEGLAYRLPLLELLPDELEPVLPVDDELPELPLLLLLLPLLPDEEELEEEPLLEVEPPLLDDDPPPPLPPPPPPPLRFHKSDQSATTSGSASRCWRGSIDDVRSVAGSGMATAETVVSSNATAARIRFNFIGLGVRVPALSRICDFESSQVSSN